MKHLIPALLNLAIEIQQIPAPTFFEAERGRFVEARFLDEGLVDVASDSLGNVFARLPGGQGRPVVVSAHLDTVFPEDTPLNIQRSRTRISGPGIGDNSLAVAGLFGLLWALREKGYHLPGDLWLVANTGEEGLGDLSGMRAVVDRFGDGPHAYLILEGTALGQIYHRGLSVRRFKIAAKTRGGHSWVNYGRPSAIHALAALAARLAGLEIPVKPRSSLNIGTFQGGISVNSIAAHAELQIDLRSVDPAALDDLTARVKALVKDAASDEVSLQIEKIGDRPAGSLPADHWLVQLAVACLGQAGLQAKLNIGSTDANIPLSRGLPAVCIGLTQGRGAHTLEEYIEIGPLAAGLEQIVQLVGGVFRQGR